MKFATLADVMHPAPEVRPIHPTVPPRRRLPLTGHHAPPCYRLFYGDFAAQPHTLTASDPALQLTEALTVLRWHAGYVLSSGMKGIDVEFLLVGVASNSGELSRMGFLTLPLAALVYAPRALPVRAFGCSALVLNDLPATHCAIPSDNGLLEWRAEERQRTRGQEVTPDNWRTFINPRRMARGGLTAR